MARIGVTGATGFIGGALVPRLAERGHSLVLVDNRTGPIRVEYAEWPAALLDFASDEALRLLSSTDAVVHLAAVSGVMACANDPVGSARVNVDGTQRLARVLGAEEIPVLFASSLAVVGSPEQLPVTEATPARPTHAYARQKADGEAAVRAAAQDHGLASSVLRMSNVYGGYTAHGRPVAKGNVLHLFAEQAASDGRLRINAPGTQRRDFVHLDDVTEHWIAVAERIATGRHGPTAVYNVASGESYSVLELARLVDAAWTRGSPPRPHLRLETVENPRGGIELIDPSFSVSRARTESALGIRCRHSVREEIDRELAAAVATVRSAR
jgi:UDP-glucose 4-epimerase